MKNKGNAVVVGILIFVIILLIALVLGFGLGVIQLKDNKNSLGKENNVSKVETDSNIVNNEVANKQDETITTQNNEKNITKIETTKNVDLLNLDSSKCLNKGADSYAISGDDEFGVYISAFDKKMHIRISSGSEIKGQASNIELDKEYEITNVDINKISQIFVLGYGQAIDVPIALFLMKDGTVEWLNIKDVLTKKDFAAEGKISNVSSVKTIVNSGAKTIVDKKTGGGPGWVTIIGVREDGCFYDLVELTVRK